MMLRRAVVLVLVAALGGAAAFAHPGSGIGVDRQGRIFFVDTGEGVWVIEADGSVRKHDGPAFHWMALDPSNGFGSTRFQHLPLTDMRATGHDPMVLLSSDFPITVGGDGALYFAEPDAEKRLHLVRMEPSGKRADFAVLPAESDGAPLGWLNGIAAGPDGSIYYSENAAIRRLDAEGALTTVAGRVSVPDCDAVDGVPKSFEPYLRDLAVAADGTVYAAANGCRAVVRIDAGGTVTTVLRAEKPWSPTAVTIAGDVLYVLEYTHPPGDPQDRTEWVPRVRRVAPDGTVSIVATIER